MKHYCITYEGGASYFCLKSDEQAEAIAKLYKGTWKII